MHRIMLTAALLSTVVAAPAMAADAVAEPPQPPVAEVAPIFTWTGPYAGIRGGGSWVDGDFSVPGASLSRSFDGGLFGGFLGYNWQLENKIVLGIEGDLNYTWNKKNVAPGVDAGTDLSGSVRGRLGYAFDRALIYGTGGWEATSGYVDTGSKDSKTFNGWTLGAGVDYAFTDKIFGRLEYRYTDFGSKNIDGIKVNLNQNAVVVGLGVKFW